MNSAHAFLPPSAASVWVVCAMWATMNQRYPERGDKPEAMEGVAAHWVGLDEMLQGRLPTVGALSPNGVAITDEMIQAGELYCDIVSAAYHTPGLVVSHYKVETRVMIPYVHANNWGTPDTWIFGHNPTTGRGKLFVIDYKFGHGHIDVFENWQLLDYTCGILDELEIDGLAEASIDVEFTIVQPRDYHKDGAVRRWSFVATEIRAYRNKLKAAAEAAHHPTPGATVNDGCDHCPGRHACQVLQREGYRAAKLSKDSTPVDMTPEAMGLELKMLTRARDLLEARVSGLAEQVEYGLFSGATNPHWFLDNEPGRVKWTKPTAEILALGALMGADLSKPDTMTPTQAKKFIDPAIVDMYSERGQGSRKLKPATNTDARKIFGRN